MERGDERGDESGEGGGLDEPSRVLRIIVPSSSASADGAEVRKLPNSSSTVK